MSDKTPPKTEEAQPRTAVDVQRLVRDAMRYRAIKEKIDYSEGTDGMTWAHLEWCVNFRSLSPVDLDEAIDQILLANQQAQLVRNWNELAASWMQVARDRSDDAPDIADRAQSRAAAYQDCAEDLIAKDQAGQ